MNVRFGVWGKKNFLENRVSKAFRGKNVWVYLKTKINFIQKGNIHGENEWKDRVGSSHKVHHKKAWNYFEFVSDF